MTENSKRQPKGPEIGLHRLRRICQLNENERLEIIADGLSIIPAREVLNHDARGLSIVPVRGTPI